MDQNSETTPLFYVETQDKVSLKKFFVNFGASSKVEFPPVDYDEDKFQAEVFKRGIELDEFKIPMLTSPIFWSKVDTPDEGRHYVIDVLINDKYAMRRILNSDMMRLILIEITFLTIESKYNAKDSSPATTHQYLGHKLDLNFKSYRTESIPQRYERSEVLVNNKVLLLSDQKQKQDEPKQVIGDKSVSLDFRPRSKILTCSLAVERLPDSIGFNDDRFIVTSDGKEIADVHLPVMIDLSQPVKYKFFENMGVFRMVFRISD